MNQAFIFTAYDYNQHYNLSLYTEGEKLIDLGDNVLVIGWYDFAAFKMGWISLFNTPNTGNGGPRGWIYVDNNLNQVTGDGPSVYEFKKPDGTVVGRLKFRENDHHPKQMYIDIGS